MNEENRAEIFLADIHAGKTPRDMQILASKGLLPYLQEQVLPILIAFLENPDEELKSNARRTLKNYPGPLLRSYIASGIGSGELDALADVLTDPELLESLALAKSAGEATLIRLSRRAHERLQEILVTNQERILACPGILEALESNPALTPNVRRRILEIREEFFGEKKPFTPSITPEEASDMGITPQEYMDLFESFHIENLSADQLFSTIEIPTEGISEEQLTLLQRYFKMTVPEKIQLALKGSQEARGILITDSAKLVREAVVASPKITEPEILHIASNRAMDEEILRHIGTSRQWARKYAVIKHLAFNPKTPVGVTLGLLARLMKKDLKELGGEKNVPDPVRQASHRLYLVRVQTG